jgi:membrane-associated phospholipid phosphatase
MCELLRDLVPWGVDVILAVQAASGNALDPLFIVITWLGDAYVYLALLPLALWIGSGHRGIRLALLLLTSMYVNLLVKDLCAIPRPFDMSAAIQAKDTASTYAFPSGHAQGVTTLWLGLAAIYRRRYPLLAGAVLIPLVSFSRVYLGVHYPQDVIGGAILGLACVAAYRLVEPPMSRWWHRRSLTSRIVVGILVVLPLAALARDANALAIAGAIIGLLVGRSIALAWPLDRQAPRGLLPFLDIVSGLMIVGAAVVSASFAYAAVFVGEITTPALATLGQTVLLGLAITFGMPWLLARLRRGRASPPTC